MCLQSIQRVLCLANSRALFSHNASQYNILTLHLRNDQDNNLTQNGKNVCKGGKIGVSGSKSLFLRLFDRGVILKRNLYTV